MKINLFNETRIKINLNILKLIETALHSFRTSRKKICNVIAIQRPRIIKLNRQFFSKKNATDVISINNPSPRNKQTSKFIGDVYICPKVIKENAKAYNVSYEEELTRIIIHGILHLLGYDHKKPFRESRERMFKIQEKLVDTVLNMIKD